MSIECTLTKPYVWHEFSGMSFFKLLLAFSPWLAFLVIAHEGWFRLQLGLGVALALSVILGLTGIHRGVILWVGLVFVSFASIASIAVIAVIGFQNLWTIRHMGVLASGMLATVTWLSVLIRKPFTLDYARANTDRSLWNDPEFLRTNVILTSIWGTIFTLNALLAFGKMESVLLQPWQYETISYCAAGLRRDLDHLSAPARPSRGYARAGAPSSTSPRPAPCNRSPSATPMPRPRVGCWPSPMPRRLVWGR